MKPVDGSHDQSCSTRVRALRPTSGTSTTLGAGRGGCLRFSAGISITGVLGRRISSVFRTSLGGFGLPEELLTRQDVAIALGCHPQRVTRFVAEGCPVAKRGRRGLGHLYRLDDVQGWLAARADAKAGPDGDLDLVQERARRDRAQRHLAEQTRETRAANLVAKDEVIAEWRRACCGGEGEAIGSSRRYSIIDDANRARAAALIREALDELADGERRTVASAGSEGRSRSGSGKRSRRSRSGRRSRRSRSGRRRRGPRDDRQGSSPHSEATPSTCSEAPCA